MARGSPDESTYQPEVSPENLPRKVTPQMEPQTEIGRGVQAIGGALEQKYNADSATWANNQLANLHTGALSTLKSMQDAQPGDQDPTGFTPRFIKAFDDQVKPLQSAEGANPLAQHMMQQGVTRLRTALFEQSKDWESLATKSYRENSLAKTIDLATAQVEADPTLKGAVGERLATTANALGGGPTEVLPRMRAIDSALTQAEANGLARQDPRGTLQALNDPDKATGPQADMVRGLNDQQREMVRAKANENLLNGVYSAITQGDTRGAQAALARNMDLLDPKQAEGAQRGINAAYEANIVRGDKAKRDASNNLLTESIYRSQQGNLDVGWINAHRQVMEPQAYEYALKLAEGKNVVTDTPTYLDLIDRTNRGEDTTQATQEAAAHGQLNQEAAVKLMDLNKENVPNYIKEGLNGIKTSAAISLLNPEPAKGATLKNMTDDWLNLSRAHPEWAKDPQAAQAAVNEIVHRYGIIDNDKQRFALPFPPWMVGSVRAPNIAASESAVFQAQQGGQISDDEFNRRAGLLQKWREVQKQEEALKAAAVAKSKAND